MKPTDPPLGECDWGNCGKMAVDWRRDDNHDWLQVCALHCFKFETDFTLPPELQPARAILNAGLTEAAFSFAELGMDRGLSEADACTVVVDTMINIAAVTALLIRRDLLDGTPDIERWRAVTEDAFNRAVEYAAREAG